MQTFLTINLDALTHNIRQIRQYIGESRIICGVVKANAYGHGLLETAKHLVHHGVERLAVVSAQDVDLLRQNHIQVPIYIMNALHPYEYEEVILHRAIPFISSKHEVTELQRQASRLNMVTSVQLKINSQMNRLGVDQDDAMEIITAIHNSSHIKLDGIALHLAQADAIDNEGVLMDIRFIDSLQSQLSSSYPNLIYNVANSAALLHYPQSLYHMIRPGIALYGYESALKIEPALSWVSMVMHIRKVTAGTPVSYGATYTTQRDTHLAIIPVGYADGFPREHASPVSVLIHNHRYPIVGRVCMNQMMIDLGERHDVQLFDTVYLIHPKRLPASELALATKTISYRILTSLNPQLPRHYISESLEA
ncbi:alanine racemase [Entomospira entomophila]|uniref:Alanine racemase n=1 Tax=Entomospira entomophila TaxID=2719988 RepID=A0A968G7S8_9SPIO|nr:alanine racemase [Entomospira entomophilus]NIZ40182.1 alanine racemase [Entomospira entomophilus]WDI35741.1 alanine racemase [Entomospira entomophilus]